MRSIRNARGICASGRRAPSASVRTRAFQAGQSRGYERMGIACFVIAILGWFLLLHTPLIWPWSIAWIVVFLVWMAVLLTAGDNDSHEAHKAQSTPGFDAGPVEQQTHDVIHRHDHH